MKKVLLSILAAIIVTAGGSSVVFATCPTNSSSIPQCTKTMKLDPSTLQKLGINCSTSGTSCTSVPANSQILKALGISCSSCGSNCTISITPCANGTCQVVVCPNSSAK